MRRWLVMVALLVVATAAVAGVALAAAGRVEARWVVVELPFTMAAAINDAGTIVGFRETDDGDVSIAVMWKGGKTRGLGTLGGSLAAAADINERGQIVGWSTTRGVGQGDEGKYRDSAHAFLWENGKMRDLGTVPGSRRTEAAAINERGVVVGSKDTAGDRAGAWMLVGRRFRALGTLGGTRAFATDVNDSGAIVGWSQTAGDETFVFLYELGRMRRLGIPASSMGASVNNRGVIVGWGSAVTWKAGRTTPLCSKVQACTAAAINDRNQVVGTLPAPGDRSVPVLIEDGRMTRLPLPRGSTSARATDINNRGQIVGYADAYSETHFYDFRALLWTKTG